MRDEFCYLNRRKHAYDYKIVDYDKRNKKEYMTISARGITHYIDNVGEFIKIEQWEKEVSLSFRCASSRSWATSSSSKNTRCGRTSTSGRNSRARTS